MTPDGNNIIVKSPYLCPVSEKTILKLQLPTDPLWVKNVVESNIEELLTDHAFCEQKAASNGITLLFKTQTCQTWYRRWLYWCRKKWIILSGCMTSS